MVDVVKLDVVRRVNTSGKISFLGLLSATSEEAKASSSDVWALNRLGRTGDPFCWNQRSLQHREDTISGAGMPDKPLPLVLRSYKPAVDKRRLQGVNRGLEPGIARRSRCQSKPGPGSNFRPGAMCSWPTASLKA